MCKINKIEIYMFNECELWIVWVMNYAFIVPKLHIFF